MAYIITIQIRGESNENALRKDITLKNEFIENPVYEHYLKVMLQNPVFELVRDTRKLLSSLKKEYLPNQPTVTIDQETLNQVQIIPEMPIEIFDSLPNLSSGRPGEIKIEFVDQVSEPTLNQKQAEISSPLAIEPDSRDMNLASSQTEEKEYRGNKPSTKTDIDVLESITMIESDSEDRQTNINIIVREGALECANKHANEDTRTETGGILLGKIIPGPKNAITVLIVGIVRALKAERGVAHVRITPDAWIDIWRSIDQDRNYREENVWQGTPIWQIVGWYHTHPTFSVFFSSIDQDSHIKWFDQPGHIALVIDPVHNDYGFFAWNRKHSRPIPSPRNQERIVRDEEMLTWIQEHLMLVLDKLPDAELQNENYARTVDATSLDSRHESLGEPSLIEGSDTDPSEGNNTSISDDIDGDAKH